jgi:hypothetical protein
MSAVASSMIPILSQTESSAHFMVNYYAKRGKKGMELAKMKNLNPFPEKIMHKKMYLRKKFLAMVKFVVIKNPILILNIDCR